jgi:hypothetical protein
VSDDDPVKVLTGVSGDAAVERGIDGADAIFRHLPTAHDADEITVHVCPGRAMLLPAGSLSGLDVAVEAVMSTSEPTRTIVIALADLRRLRIRLDAHLNAPGAAPSLLRRFCAIHSADVAHGRQEFADQLGRKRCHYSEHTMRWRLRSLEVRQPPSWTHAHRGQWQTWTP